MKSAARRLGCGLEEIVVVGDDPELEVRMALEGGALAVAVHTGIADADATAASEFKADLSLPGVADLLELIK